MQAMEAERTKVNVARERAVVVHQEAQTEHKRAVMMVLLSSCRPAKACLGCLCNDQTLLSGNPCGMLWLVSWPAAATRHTLACEMSRSHG